MNRKVNYTPAEILARLRSRRIEQGLCTQCGEHSLRSTTSDVCVDCDAIKTRRRLIRQHSFDADDLQRYLAATLCDWCGLPFSDLKRPHVDHDHRCCDSGRTAKHCWFCTRGFLHYNCNQRILWAHEFIEAECDFISPQLAAYRVRFPVPRVKA
jgi:hypothetical protein